MYLCNRSPTKALAKMTPFEVLTDGQIPDVLGLRVFGCQAYVHILKDSKSKRCIFLGYGANTKGYHPEERYATAEMSYSMKYEHEELSVS